MHKRLNEFLEHVSTVYNLLSVLIVLQAMHSCQSQRIFRLSQRKKAFDTVDHDILIEKLDHYGVRGAAKDCFISYLKGRRQLVAIENETSTNQEILSGVLQGSVLGPLLFPIYINDLNTCIQFSKTYHFANDTNIMQSNKSLKVLAKQMNKELRANKLCLKVQKTGLMIFCPTSFKTDSSIKFKQQI